MTHEEIEAARTVNGGWTRAQLAEWGVPWPPPRGWKATLAWKAAPRMAETVKQGSIAKQREPDQRPNIGNYPTKSVE